VQPLINYLKHKDSKLTSFKKDTYDLGMILLEISLLAEFKSDMEYNFEELKQYYSPEWINFLYRLTDVNISRRPDPLSIFVTPEGLLQVSSPH